MNKLIPFFSVKLYADFSPTPPADTIMASCIMGQLHGIESHNGAANDAAAAAAATNGENRGGCSPLSLCFARHSGAPMRPTATTLQRAGPFAASRFCAIRNINKHTLALHSVLNLISSSEL